VLSIPRDYLAELRDRALISTTFFRFAQVSAVLASLTQTACLLHLIEADIHVKRLNLFVFFESRGRLFKA
jgi:hypothetical protein